jgi:PAS domain S-box-containing protein
MRIEPRTWAGADAGYFEMLDMCIDVGSTGRHAPGGRAYHKREIAISQDISADDRYEEWREQAIKWGFQALAVVPLEYNETLHGLLAVVADHRYAFDDREQNLLTELGQDIAHAMHAQQVQTDLRDREQILDEILERTTVPMFLKNRKGEYILVNEQFRALFDLADTEVQGQTDSDLFDPETVAEVQENDQEVLETGDPIETEEQINVDGDQRVYLSSKTPGYDIGTVADPDDPVAIFGVASDITDRD